MDGIKEHLIPKRFSILSYICVIIHLSCGVIFTAITTALRLSEMEKFSCAVDTKHATHKSYVEKTCFSIYDDEYNSDMKLFGFVLLNFGFVVVVSVVYSLAVGNRIKQAERLSSGSDEPQTVARGNNEQGRKTFYVFNFYLFHLVARSMLCILFTILQHTVLYPSGFDSQFSCNYPKLSSTHSNTTRAKNTSGAKLSSVRCTNSAARDKESLLVALSLFNGIFGIIALAEFIYLLVKGFSPCIPQAWSCDLEFIFEYFLREQYVHPEKVELIGIKNSCDVYKEKVLQLGLTSDIRYVSKYTPLDDMFIDFVIHTEQAPHKFSKGMDRHEIYNVYMKVPENSILLKEIKELFYPNKDSENKIPSTILVIGRPGIGKTVLTRKIMRDWAKEHNDKVYHNKVAFHFKFREFHVNEMRDTLTIKKFLQFGTELSEDEFESIFEEIWRNPQNAIFIFDGLDEFGVNLGENIESGLTWSSKYSNDDVSCQMSAMILFIKILSGDMLPGATVLVTSRPTVNHVLCQLKFDKTVEIVGFTPDKIEQYVKQFCANHDRCDLEATLLSHIKSSSELMNLCYIPVNCFIVCVSLFGCLIDSEGDIGVLPTTLTELYESALVYFNMYHDRNKSKEVLKKLQELAFNGMENDELIFIGELVDEKMRESGLLNSLPNPTSGFQMQVCFIHITIQEFLTAKHIVETKTPQEVKKFISSHFGNGRWHLVLQFLAGLLGMKMRRFHQYRSCVLSFKGYLEFVDTAGIIHTRHILVMKCLREARDENVAKEIAANSALKDVTEISCSTLVIRLLSPSDVAAVVFVCKHLNFLNRVRFEGMPNDFSMEGVKLLHGRCLKSLTMRSCDLCDMGVRRCATLLTSECQLNHSHSKLTKLCLSHNNISDSGVAYLNEFLQNKHKVWLEELDLFYNDITSRGIPALLEFLSSEVCNQLTELNLGRNDISDEGVRFLCSGIRERRLKLEKLNLSGCSLTNESIPWLLELLSDEHCQITDLIIANNLINDKGVEMLCEVFRQETCKLTELDLSSCSLTETSMVAFGKALNEGKCGLKDLKLGYNKIGDKGMRILCSVLEQGKCNLTSLNVSSCSLTDECMPILCQALGDERCKLTELVVSDNGITDKHLSLLSDTLKFPNWYLKYLNITGSITEAGKKILNETMRSNSCKERGLNIYCMSTC